MNVERHLTTNAHLVKAGGPLDPSVAQVIELCVWVFQRASTDEAIAQGMGPEGQPMAGMAMTHVTGKGTPAAHWDMELEDREGTTAVDFVNGSATAVAIGAFLINTPTGQKRRGFFWSEPVEIKLPSAAS
ncbi:MAG: hypothetical protein E5W82_18525 [Mesorhizobium sp.]|uniref:hypothetical protein n=1 Tax=Mesorhizobium sp. TaxID=1871066 RepID=UPI0012115DFD|nr:hypothetical protein [Mesorhizobium sp.]TIS56677.1 MAG: hypothetical protein E5W91_17470 [Mesorhizobium sp.]TIS89067.1 MAG: hypothetical protein E5W89_17165 [Mesorhizobium sp.]TJW10901.1 MAG: hypothetical protein E5W82_18525 [Mesorhizobium sp.]TJW37321.1 MAG: hypothetical protein E5W83_33235 [Mesorhizobium sp.]